MVIGAAGEPLTMKNFLLSVLLASSILAGPPAESRPRILTGEVSQERVFDLTNKIHWYSSLNQAESVARQQGKLVFWIHMLGSLDGAT
jgi:hypothetical protein